VPAQDPNGFVPSAGPPGGYALGRVYSLDDQDVALCLGDGPRPRLWLNGRRVCEGRAAPAAAPDDPEAWPVRLRKGWNVLAAQGVGDAAAPGFYACLSESPEPLPVPAEGEGP
jgi:hypothetical protein